MVSDKRHFFFPLVVLDLIKVGRQRNLAIAKDVAMNSGDGQRTIPDYFKSSRS
jgi:hypothetical protein